MKLAVIVGAFFAGTWSLLAQMKITQIHLNSGFYRPFGHENTNISDFASLAPNSVLLSKNLSTFQQEPGSQQVSFQSLLLGMKLPSWSGTLRVGVANVNSILHSCHAHAYESYVVDTLISQQNGSMTFVDSIAQKFLIGQYSNQQIRLEAAYIWEMNAGDRWAFSAGAGVSFGLSYRSKTQVLYLENTNSYQGFNGTQGTQTHHTQTETFNNPMAFGANFFVPLGIQFQLGNKRPFWMPWMLYTEFRPQVALHSIPTLGFSFCPGIGATGGIRYNLPSRLGAAHLRYEEF